MQDVKTARSANAVKNKDSAAFVFLFMFFSFFVEHVVLE